MRRLSRSRVEKEPETNFRPELFNFLRHPGLDDGVMWRPIKIFPFPIQLTFHHHYQPDLHAAAAPIAISTWNLLGERHRHEPFGRLFFVCRESLWIIELIRRTNVSTVNKLMDMALAYWHIRKRVDATKGLPNRHYRRGERFPAESFDTKAIIIKAKYVSVWGTGLDRARRILPEYFIRQERVRKLRKGASAEPFSGNGSIRCGGICSTISPSAHSNLLTFYMEM